MCHLKRGEDYNLTDKATNNVGSWITAIAKARGTIALMKII
jgi:hypothetical protein